MRIGSLFAGIGGLDLACEWAFEGSSVAWQLDLTNEHIRAAHWPNARQIVGDVNAVSFAGIEPIDVLCGGFACQDLSSAGRQASRGDLHAGKRSGATYRGLLRFVAHFKPSFVVIENVPAVLEHRALIERDLADYGLTWVRCYAADVGAPHMRRRVVIVGERGKRGQGFVDAPSVDLVGRVWATITASNPNETEDAAEWHGRRAELAARGINGNGAGEPLGQMVRVWPTATAQGTSDCPSERVRHSPSLESTVQVMSRPWPTAMAADANNVKTQGPGRPSLNFEARQCEDGKPGRRLNPDWVELLMGFPIGWTRPIAGLKAEPSPRWPRGRYPEGWDRSKVWPGHDWEPPRTLPDGPPCPGRPARIRGLGNAVCPQQGDHAIRVALRPAQRGLFDAA